MDQQESSKEETEQSTAGQVLRSLCQREPTITVEEGLRKGLQEWQRTRNFDRMIVYETAEKFMEFEAAEELDDPRMQLAGVFQSPPPPNKHTIFPEHWYWVGRVRGVSEVPNVPPHDCARYSTWCSVNFLGSSVEVVWCMKACTSRKTSLKAQPAPSLAAKFKVPQTKVSESKVSTIKAGVIKIPETTALEEIPPEDVQEYEGNTDHLVGPPNFATCEPYSSFMGELAANLGQEELEQQPIDDDLYPDLSLFSYVDEDFVKKVETMIQPCFLEELLPSKSDINILTLTKELEQEEELTSGQVDRGKRASQYSRLGGPHGTANGCSVDNDLQSLDFLLVSQHHLLPWGLSQSQGPHVETLCSGEQALQAPLPQRGGLSHHPSPATMSMNRALTGYSYSVEKMSCSGPP
ncbi:NUT family member 2E [Sciurus carolinensis]|uniref:NUT family member 2E n=1 Tax=Sciurus carolinensis TaxID=30640 RepID=A0AA41T7J6_SCICA|nr:NUT family member 2E [Sciurus carolinensis]